MSDKPKKKTVRKKKAKSKIKVTVHIGDTSNIDDTPLVNIVRELLIKIQNEEMEKKGAKLKDADQRY